MLSIRIRDRQTVIDIAMQEAGDLESALLVAEANGLSISDSLYTGQPVIAPTVVFDYVVNSFKKDERYPASADTIIKDADGLFEGIEFWSIEVDFIVQ